MTYRSDSDIFMPYGQIARRIPPTKNNSVVVNSKPKLAAWFVSHCVTLSRREKLVRKLVKYLPPNSVDIYGHCGPEKCPRGKSKESCWSMVEQNYKFYFSLENSVCKDYVTEKMFDTLKHNIVPIVLGGANYSAVFPPKSFINMRDFQHMKDLAEYLLRLQSNNTEYYEYFEWKGKYEVMNSKEDFHQAHCKLCEFLHDKEGETRIVDRLSKWWLEDSNCV